MAKFLNTTATNYHLEELIKRARERLIIISPYLKFNERMKELLEDKDRMKIDVRIIYGKSELNPQETTWLSSLEFVRTSFCQNLHAKCYLNEEAAIITSMNLYEFSQVNNNEMGVLLSRDEEAELYRETLDEAMRLIRISEQIRLHAEKVEDPPVEEKEQSVGEPQKPKSDSIEQKYDKLSSSRIAKALGMKTGDFLQQLQDKGFLLSKDGELELTPAGKAAGGEHRVSPRFGPYFIWPKDMEL